MAKCDDQPFLCNKPIILERISSNYSIHSEPISAEDLNAQLNPTKKAQRSRNALLAKLRAKRPHVNVANESDKFATNTEFNILSIVKSPTVGALSLPKRGLLPSLDIFSVATIDITILSVQKPSSKIFIPNQQQTSTTNHAYN